MLDGDPAPHGKGHRAPTLRLMVIMANRSPISAIAEYIVASVNGNSSCRLSKTKNSAVFDKLRNATPTSFRTDSDSH